MKGRPKKFPEGTRVRLKTGGAEMIVQGYHRDAMDDLSWDFSNAICVWQDKDNKPQAEIYHVDSIEPV